MSAIAPNATCRNVHFESAFGVSADLITDITNVSLLTQSGPSPSTATENTQLRYIEVKYIFEPLKDDARNYLLCKYFCKVVKYKHSARFY